jgi:hypothetical protein
LLAALLLASSASVEATATSSPRQQLEFLQQDVNSYAPDERSRDAILATVPTRGYNANIPTFEMLSHAALSAAASWAAYETGAEWEEAALAVRKELIRQTDQIINAKQASKPLTLRPANQYHSSWQS